jgi:mRNA interferase HigB
MKVHLIKKQIIENFVLANARSRSSFNLWLSAIKYADWDKPENVKQTFGTAGFLGNNSNRIVFDIGGNNYRMICKYHTGKKQFHLFICWIGTHAAYDELCKKNLQYSINTF